MLCIYFAFYTYIKSIRIIFPINQISYFVKSIIGQLNSIACIYKKERNEKNIENSVEYLLHNYVLSHGWEEFSKYFFFIKKHVNRLMYTFLVTLGGKHLVPGSMGTMCNHTPPIFTYFQER